MKTDSASKADRSAPANNAHSDYLKLTDLQKISHEDKPNSYSTFSDPKKADQVHRECFSPISTLSTQIKCISGCSVLSTHLSDAYEVLDDLGVGTFGSVKLGRQRGTGNLVAIKILEKARIRD